jgi:peptide chain release factor 1
MPDATLNTDQLQKLEENWAALEAALSDPQSAGSREYPDMVRRHRELSKLLGVWRQAVRAEDELEGAKELLDDESAQIRELAQEDIAALTRELASLKEELQTLLLPKDPNDARNTIVEIRAGTGGDEAALFAGDLYRMYTRYAERMRWQTELLSSSPSGGLGQGFKEVVFLVRGGGAHSRLKHESGVHRVQRVPQTEGQGRVHTSAVTVAVLPEPQELEADVKPDEVRVDVFRSSGPGGQSVNTTDSAVRVTHLPTGLVVTCQDEKSQLKNKQKAMTVLRARLLARASAERQQKISEERRGQVGSGDRSERIRTYNFQQGRVTDHRAGLTLYSLDSVMDGALDEIIAKTGAWFQAQELAREGGPLSSA